MQASETEASAASIAPILGTFDLDHDLADIEFPASTSPLTTGSWPISDVSIATNPFSFIDVNFSNAETSSLDQSLPENSNLWPAIEGDEDAVLSNRKAPSGRSENVHISTPATQNSLILSHPQEIFNVPSALSTYFFKEVIGFYSVWDSKLNAMRIMTEALWQHSGPLYHTMQSIAATCLSNELPHLASVALTERAQAMKLLNDNTVFPSMIQEDKALCIHLLGYTISWLDPDDLALDGLKASHKLLEEWAADTTQVSTNMKFFRDDFDYWAMLLAFFADGDTIKKLRTSSADFLGPTEPEGRPFLPHAWIGISSEIVNIITDVALLISRHRKKMSNISFLTQNDFSAFQEALREARILEKRLLCYRSVDVQQFLDPGDAQTPVAHFQKMEEAYRYTGLLQLYRVFPDLLCERYRPFRASEILHIRPVSKQPSTEERDMWLTQLALHIVKILMEIPLESHSRAIQPMILVAASSELRYDSSVKQLLPQTSLPHEAQPGNKIVDFGGAYKQQRLQLATTGFCIDNASIEVARARRFVKSRLSAFLHILPARKMHKIQELVRLTWAALDAGQSDVYWLDIANKEHLCPLMA